MSPTIIIIVRLIGQDQTLILGNQVSVGLEPLLSLVLPVDFDAVTAAIKVSKRLFRMRLLRVEPSNLCIEFTHRIKYAPSRRASF